MSVLLIGGDSYVGRSITLDFEKMGKDVTSFSSKKIYSKYSYAEFECDTLDSFEFAIVIGTPGHFGSKNDLGDNSKLINCLSQSNLNVYVISTIHTLAEKISVESEYVRLNRDFERNALHNNFVVVRIPNFIGIIPEVDEKQAGLLPWSLLDNFRMHGFLLIKSNLGSEFEWITSTDLCNAILILENSAPGNVEVQPGYKCTLGELAQTFSKFAAEQRGVSVGIQEKNLENVRNVIAGRNSIGALGWKTELTDRMLHDYIGEYLRKNWSKNG